jgi:hypothetical protein
LLLIDFVFVPPETWARFGAPVFLHAAEKFRGDAIAGASTVSAVRVFGGIWERLDFTQGAGGEAELRSAWTGETPVAPLA